MEPKTGLLIWWILTTILLMTDGGILAMPDRGCLVEHRINHTKSMMEKILVKFLLANGNDIRLLPKPISELDLKNLTTEEKRHRAQCGLHYMQWAVELIDEHQSNLSSSANPIPKEIKNVLKDTINCVAGTIGQCTNRTKKPVFWHTNDTYERKQWSHTVLNNSVVFLDELKSFININAKKTTTYG